MSGDLDTWASSRGGWAEGLHPRDEVGKFSGTGGGAGSSTWRAVKTEPVPKREGKPGGGAGAQLPEGLRTRLKALGVSKLPAAHIGDVQVSDRVDDDENAHEGALLKWTDDHGNAQSSYSEEFDKQNAAAKWERVLRNRPVIEEALDDLREKAAESPAHAAALLIAETGLRPGSDDSLEATGHYGATTMESRHVTFDDEAASARIEYVGKAGKANVAEVSEPSLVAALRAHTEGKEPNDRVFDVSRAKVAAAAPEGVKLKDFRTSVATTLAEKELEGVTLRLTGNERTDARAVLRVLKDVSTTVSKRLNNTPAMARKAYIAPQVIQAWAKRNGVNPAWVE